MSSTKSVQQNSIMIGLGIVFISCDRIFGFKAYHDKGDQISWWSWFQLDLISSPFGQYDLPKQSGFLIIETKPLHFISLFPKVGVDKSEIYVNTSTNTDGALIKVGDRYYRALNGSEPDSTCWKWNLT